MWVLGVLISPRFFRVEKKLDSVPYHSCRATALACAVKHGNTEVCRFLLERGADMDLLPSSSLEACGGKPLTSTSLVELAAQCGHLDTMNLLIQAKVFKDNTGAAVGVQG